MVTTPEVGASGTGSSRVQAELQEHRERVKVSPEFCSTSPQSEFIGTSAFSYQRTAGGPASEAAR